MSWGTFPWFVADKPAGRPVKKEKPLPAGGGFPFSISAAAARRVLARSCIARRKGEEDMKKRLICILLALVLVLCLCACGGSKAPTYTYTDPGQKLRHAEITIRDYGTIKLELDEGVAPITVENFVELANQGFYNGLTFLPPHH